MKKVICTDAECTNLTYKKEYEVLNKWKQKSKIKPYESYDVYLVIDDMGNESAEPSCLFEDIEEKELNIIEASNMPLGTEFEIKYQNGKTDTWKCKVVEGDSNNLLSWISNDNSIGGTQDIINAKFIIIKTQKPVSFMEAVSSEKNMIKVDIEDIICGLSENMKEQLREYNTIGATLYCLSNHFTNESLVKIFQEGKWYIED